MVRLTGSAQQDELSYDPATRTLTLDPAGNLERGATYIATDTTGVKEDTGTVLAQQKAWSFTAKR